VAVVTLADIQAELPQIPINGSTQPSDAQVTGYLADISAEVTGLLEAEEAQFPTDTTSPAYQFLRRTIIEGVINLVLRAKYALTPASAQPAEVSLAATAYRDKLNRLKAIARAIILQTQSPTTGGYTFPIAIASDPTPGMMAMSFADWTLRRNIEEQRRLGALGYPFTLYPGRGIPW
jgi:hypothetical protein